VEMHLGVSLAPAVFLGAGAYSSGPARHAFPDRDGAATISLITSRNPAGDAGGRSQNGWLLVYCQERGVWWWIEIQPHYVSRLGTEFRIDADAPTPAPLEADIVTAQDPPDLISAHIPQTLRQAAALPLRITLRGRFI
jgi:hypothetical protein